MAKGDLSGSGKSTEIQFDLLCEIDSILGAASIPYWLRGGWALDFWLGRITRPHSDIDLVIWERRAPEVRSLLRDAHFECRREREVQIDFSKAMQDIGVVLISRNREGQISTPGIPEWRWRTDALLPAPRDLRGLTCCVLSLEQLLEEKEGYQKGTGRAPCEKDLRGMVLIRELLERG